MAAVHVIFALMLALQQASSTRAPASPRERQVADLLQAASSQETASKLRPPNPADWFGGFAAGESTYDQDGTLAGRQSNAQINVADGWNPHQKNPFDAKAVAPRWFQESGSGGSKQAWQTVYPAAETSFAGNRAQTGEWFEGAGGVLQQEYRDAADHEPGNIPASWFDDSVRQLDGFGRTKLPGLGSLRNYVDWEERSVNTSLECKAPGCMANSSLKAPFDFNTEMFKNCRLTVLFRPTDFDDWYSGEYIEWVQVNGRTISTKCHPHAAGCNQTAQRPLIPCVSDLEIDTLMPNNGALNLAAKIPDSVDECPYKGKMLSAVPTVTCLVSRKGKISVPVPVSKTSCETKMPLKCATKGCAAEIAIPVDPDCAKLGQCALTIEVQQTDFDNQDGTTELIEYIKVDGKEVKKNLKPGQNPCKSKWSGKPLQLTQMNYTALTNHAVNVTSGLVRVEGKISKYVDECASNGFLFDAIATVRCGKASKTLGTLLQKSKAPAATAHRRQLKVSRN